LYNLHTISKEVYVNVREDRSSNLECTTQRNKTENEEKENNNNKNNTENWVTYIYFGHQVPCPREFYNIL
jgi:hypothetical protein